MNLLVAEMRRSLKELDLGLKGELTITSDMEDLSDSLFFDQVIFLSKIQKVNLIYSSKISGTSLMDKTGLCFTQWFVSLVCRPVTQN